MRLVWLTAAVSFLIDQVSKYVVIHAMELWRVGRINVLDPWLVFIYGENHGINFGIGGDGVNAWVWIFLAFGVCAWLLWWMSKNEMTTVTRFCAGLVIGGALGNVVDRALYGYVLDFLNMSCCGFNNPYVFNIADIFIFAGAIGLVLLTPDGKKAA